MMQGLIASYRRQTALRDGQIPALDGVRAAMVLLIAAFHFWQQSWLTPVIALPGRRLSLDFLLRSGYLWVDGLLLLSGFLLYLPHAEAKEGAKPPPVALPFYRKRFFRIVPSYLLNLAVVFFAVALPENRYAAAGDAAKDVLAHLTFTHTLFPFSYLNTPLNGVLWTLGVEMQFYLLFPLLARAFRKMPLATWLAMALTAFGFRAYASSLPDSAMLFNQLPAFLDVYANGFVAASVFVSLRRRMKEDVWTRILLTACAFAALGLILALLREQAAQSGAQAIRAGQMARRFSLSVYLSLFILGVSLGLGGVRLLFGNPVARLLSQMSLQFYLWHQVLAVQLRVWGFPPSAVPNPNQAGDRGWQIAYLLCCWLGALGISALVTFLFERPLAARLGGRGRAKRSRKENQA